MSAMTLQAIPAMGSRSLHLTRRGRVVRALVMLSLLVAASVPAASALPSVGLRVARAADAAVAINPSPGARVVVQAGDSLWLIATRARPALDPRGVIDDIRALNGLHSNLIHPGQVLVIPAEK